MVLIGIDGGGTKTSCAAYRDGGCIASARSGPMNYNFIGIHQAAENLLKGIAALGIPAGDIAAVGIGDPSIDDLMPTKPDSPTAKFVGMVSEKLGVPVFVRSDAYITLFGLTGGGRPGVLMLSGTGAMGIAEDADGNICAAGGWGRLTGDEGSGYYIASEAVKAALHAADGISPPTALTDALTDYFGVKNVRELIPLFYPEEGEADIAGFAKTAAECAEKGDACAKKILLDAAGYLAAYTCVLIEKSGAETVGVYGSVLTGNSIVRREFERIVGGRYPQCRITEPPVSPEKAAAMYAGSML